MIVQNGSNVTESELIEFINERVAHFKYLRGGVEFVDHFPRTAIGKIDRKVLRAKAKAIVIKDK